jgi:hypothetical protein
VQSEVFVSSREPPSLPPRTVVTVERFPLFECQSTLRCDNVVLNDKIINGYFILLRLYLLGNEGISDILVKLKKFATENTDLLPEVYGEDDRGIK